MGPLSARARQMMKEAIGKASDWAENDKLSRPSVNRR
jgi:hypothetical protein